MVLIDENSKCKKLKNRRKVTHYFNASPIYTGNFLEPRKEVWVVAFKWQHHFVGINFCSYF